jgi:pimeloyl-ACP methyl ester carboxylesterase
MSNLPASRLPATYALIHGAGDVGWYWHLVEAQLRQRGQETVAMDLPAEDDSAGLSEYADVVVDAIGDRRDVVVVAQSFGGYTAPMVCERIRARLLVLVAGMIPSPGESADEMFINTGYQRPQPKDSSELAVFYHDVPPSLAKQALARGRRQSETPGQQPWPLAAWPDVPTRYLLCRNDRFFPAAWVRRVVRDRLGITPDEIDTGHTPALSRPEELAERLEAYTHALPRTD